MNQGGRSTLAYLYKAIECGLGKALSWSRMVVLVSQQFTDDPKFQVLNTTASGITSLTLAEKDLWLGSKGWGKNRTGFSGTFLTTEK